MFEKLESRQLLSAGVTVSVSGGVMTVTGGSQADIITVNENAGNANFYDGKTGASFSASGITAINISGGGKNDQIFYTGNTVGANVHMRSVPPGTTAGLQFQVVPRSSLVQTAVVPA